MTHVVVLGAGLGGIPMAYEMRDLLEDEDWVTVISPTDRFQFVPSNPWVAVNWRAPEDIVVPLQPALRKQDIDLITVGARRLHPAENMVELADGERVEYDYLVIATGPQPAFDEIPGFGPQAGYTKSLCQVDQAAAAAKDWERFCADPGPIVVGAVQGASCFWPAYELAMIMDIDLRRRKIRDRAPITFVTPEPHIGHLGLGGVGDTANQIQSALAERQIPWITNARIERFEPDRVFATEFAADGSLKAAHEVPFKFCIMLPAFRGIPALLEEDGRPIEGLTDERGFVLVDRHQRNARWPNIFAVGACIAIPPVEQTPVALAVPKTGYMTESMVTAAARNIHALINGREAAEQASWNAVCLADFGDTGVAFVAIPQIPPRNVNWSSKGKWVHLAKVAYERYFLRKVRLGVSEPFYEEYILKLMGIKKLRDAGVGRS